MVSMIESSGRWRVTFGQQTGLQEEQPEADRKVQADYQSKVGEATTFQARLTR
jgi:hypothetical protein